jgi:hypothetical protein
LLGGVCGGGRGAAFFGPGPRGGNHRRHFDALVETLHDRR